MADSGNETVYRVCECRRTIRLKPNGAWEDMDGYVGEWYASDERHDHKPKWIPPEERKA